MHVVMLVVHLVSRVGRPGQPGRPQSRAAAGRGLGARVPGTLTLITGVIVVVVGLLRVSVSGEVISVSAISGSGNGRRGDGGVTAKVSLIGGLLLLQPSGAG